MWEKVTDSLVSLHAFNIFRLSTLQSCCKSAIVSSVVVAFVASCEQWLHLCSTINLARFSAINLNCTSFCSCDKNEQVEVESCSLPPAMPLIYDRPTWVIIHSSFFPLSPILSLSVCVFLLVSRLAASGCVLQVELLLATLGALINKWLRSVLNERRTRLLSPTTCFCLPSILCVCLSLMFCISFRCPSRNCW